MKKYIYWLFFLYLLFMMNFCSLGTTKKLNETIEGITTTKFIDSLNNWDFTSREFIDSNNLGSEVYLYNFVDDKYTLFVLAEFLSGHSVMNYHIDTSFSGDNMVVSSIYGLIESNDSIRVIKKKKLHTKKNEIISGGVIEMNGCFVPIVAIEKGKSEMLMTAESIHEAFLVHKYGFAKLDEKGLRRHGSEYFYEISE